MSRVSNLHRLQELDLEIKRSEERIAEIHELLSNDQRVAQASAAVVEADAELVDVRSIHSAARHKVEAQRSKIEQSEKALYGGSVTNPKELQDLQMEAESLKRYLVTLEDRLLEAMLALDKAESVKQAAETQLIEAEGQTAQDQAELRGELNSLGSGIERATTEREAALHNVSPDDLALYQRFVQKYGGLAIALVKDASCSICGVDLARSVQQTVRSGTEIINCTQCGRILYSEI
jgi:predicted  nucleic acid-binding Zn-ribbon protein